jgi:quercetin dioxygenase-like cupin family protein
MAELVRTGMWVEGAALRDYDLEGHELGTDATLILTDMDEGQGPRLHKHPYPETWVVTSGTARFTAGDETIVATTGDVVNVEAELPHKFVAVGSTPLRMLCIHHAPKFTTVWLEPKRERQPPAGGAR